MNKRAVAASAAAIFAASAFAIAAHSETVPCRGTNTCKGQSTCKGAQAGCKGQNQCRGKVVTDANSELECAAIGGKVEKPQR